MGTACSGSSLEDYLVYTTAPQSPTYGVPTSRSEEAESDENRDGETTWEDCRSVEVQPRFVTSLPGFRRLSTTGDSLLQIAPTETRQIG